MGIIYCCDPAQKVTYSVWEGAIHREDWSRHIEIQVSDPEWSASQRFISDQTGIMVFDTMDWDAIRQQAERFRAVNPELSCGRVALVASQYFEQIKMIGTVMAKKNVRVIVFNTLDTACLYLGLDVDKTRCITRHLRKELRRYDPQPVGLKVDFGHVLRNADRANDFTI